VDGTEAVKDDFDDGTLDPSWTPYSTGGIVITETGGELVIDIQPELLVGHYGEIASPAHTLAGCQVSIHVTQIPPDGTSGGVLVLTDGAAGDRLEMSYGNGYIGCIYWIADMPTFIADAPYDPVAHAWWRLRESGGTTYFETSPDGISYQFLASLPNPFPVTSMRIALFGNAGPGPGPGGEMHLDRLNLPP
jgi:hypothetical protein